MDVVPGTGCKRAISTSDRPGPEMSMMIESTKSNVAPAGDVTVSEI